MAAGDGTSGDSSAGLASVGWSDTASDSPPVRSTTYAVAAIARATSATTSSTGPGSSPTRPRNVSGTWSPTQLPSRRVLLGRETRACRPAGATVDGSGSAGSCILGQVVTEPCVTVVDAPQPRLVELTTQQLEPATGSLRCLLL